MWTIHTHIFNIKYVLMVVISGYTDRQLTFNYQSGRKHGNIIERAVLKLLVCKMWKLINVSIRNIEIQLRIFVTIS